MPWKVYPLINSCEHYRRTGKHCEECSTYEYKEGEDYRNSITYKTLVEMYGLPSSQNLKAESVQP